MVFETLIKYGVIPMGERSPDLLHSHAYINWMNEKW